MKKNYLFNVCLSSVCVDEKRSQGMICSLLSLSLPSICFLIFVKEMISLLVVIAVAVVNSKVRLKRCRGKWMSAGQSECPEEVKNCPKKSVLTIEHDERLKNFNWI